MNPRHVLLTWGSIAQLIAGAASAQTPDPLAGLARDATAVLGTGAEARLVLDETDHGVQATRVLAIGEEYRDGWVIETLAGRSVTLRKGEQKRSFALLGRPIPIGTPPSITVAPAPQIANNPSPPRAPPIAVAAPAPAAANPVLGAGTQAQEAARAAQTAGASVQEIARIYVSLSPALVGTGVDPSTARWVRVGEQPMIAMTARDAATGRETRMLTASPNRDYVPPGGIASLPLLTDLPPLASPPAR